MNPYENVLSPQTVPALIADWGSEEPYPYLLSSVVARGVVYVDSWVCDPFCHSAVTAVDTGSGAAIWTRGFHQVNNYSSPTVAGGIVYIAPKHRLFALNAATGAKRWSVVLGHTDITSAAVAEGTVYVATDYGEDLFALDASSGVVLWSQRIGEDAYSTPSVSGGAVYAGTSDGVLHALNASTGAPIWTFQTGGSLGCPAVTGGVVYVGSHDGNVYAVDARTGAEIWSSPAGEAIDSSPAVANGVVYIGSGTSSVLALDALSGARLWTAEAANFGEASPEVVNGTVYVGLDAFGLV